VTPANWGAQLNAHITGIESALGFPIDRPVSGNYKSLPEASYQGPGVAALVEAELVLYPLLLLVPATITSLAVRSNGGASTGGLIRFGIYGDTAGVPDALIVDAGSTAGTPNYSNIGVTLSQTLDRGLYWVCVVGQGTPTTQATLNTTTGPTAIPTVMGSNSVAACDGTSYIGYNQAGVTGALPANTSGLTLRASGGSANHPTLAVGFGA
jgi:hypothetical protein